MYFITTKRMLEVCFFQHTPTFIIEPFLYKRKQTEKNLRLNCVISTHIAKSGREIIPA